eukprot:11182004-Lingulodinium_polyedra.AAC.1
MFGPPLHACNAAALGSRAAGRPRPRPQPTCSCPAPLTCLRQLSYHASVLCVYFGCLGPLRTVITVKAASTGSDCA